MKSKEEILATKNIDINTEFHNYEYLYKQIIFAMEEYGKLMYNQAIENVTNIIYCQTLESGDQVDVIDKSDLLKLKK